MEHGRDKSSNLRKRKLVIPSYSLIVMSCDIVV